MPAYLTTEGRRVCPKLPSALVADLELAHDQLRNWMSANPEFCDPDIGDADLLYECSSAMQDVFNSSLYVDMTEDGEQMVELAKWTRKCPPVHHWFGLADTLIAFALGAAFVFCIRGW